MKTKQKLTTKYEVRFTCYQYNGGGNIHNGNIQCEISCLTLEEAIDRSKDVKAALASHSREFASQYVWDGFVSTYDGIYKIIEEKINDTAIVSPF
jgi:hypothetical protein